MTRKLKYRPRKVIMKGKYYCPVVPELGHYENEGLWGYDKLVHNKGNGDSILGYLAFLKDIEPQTYNNIIAKYSQYCKEDIIETLKK